MRPNGADLAPEYLYFRAFRDEPELQEQFMQWGISPGGRGCEISRQGKVTRLMGLSSAGWSGF